MKRVEFEHSQQHRGALSVGLFIALIVACSTPIYAAEATPPPVDEIAEKYASMGGALGVLGSPASEPQRTADGTGLMCTYADGTIASSPFTGTHEVHGPIEREWSRRGGEAGALGYPLTDVLTLNNTNITKVCFERGAIYLIERPDVSRAMTEYPDVVLTEGERLTLAAGGCAQTGGCCVTWKRYVDPVTSYSDLYRATVWVPGATDVLEPLAQVVSEPLTIGPGAEHILHLGYVDDDYSGNGYTERDHGTFDQCVGEPDAFVVAVIESTKSGFQQTTRHFDLVGLGTSIVWGQGLMGPNKFITEVASWLRGELPSTIVHVHTFAHSGAAIVAPRATKEPLGIGGEVPVAFPLLSEQLNAAARVLGERRSTRADAQLVLVDGGINDVSVFNIVNPKLTPADISKLTAERCIAPMRGFLEDVLKTFPTALVVLVGYYPIFTEHTTDENLSVALRKGYRIHANKSLREQECALSRAWADSSNAGFERVAAELNNASQEPRVLFVPVALGPDQGLMAGDGSLLFGPLDTDPAAEERREQATRAGSSAPPEALVADVGHPNQRGERMYADAIIEALRPRVAGWKALPK
jgi:LGFP repeat